MHHKPNILPRSISCHTFIEYCNVPLYCRIGSSQHMYDANSNIKHTHDVLMFAMSRKKPIQEPVLANTYLTSLERLIHIHTSSHTPVQIISHHAGLYRPYLTFSRPYLVMLASPDNTSSFWLAQTMLQVTSICHTSSY